MVQQSLFLDVGPSEMNYGRIEPLARLVVAYGDPQVTVADAEGGMPS